MSMPLRREPPPATRHTRIVEARLREAATTLSRLPRPELGRLSHLRALWPQTALEGFDLWVSYGRTRARVKLRPSADQIDRCDEMLGLITCLNVIDLPLSLPGDTGKIVFFRAAGMSWRVLGKVRVELYQRLRPADPRPPGGVSHVSLRKIYKQGVYLLECHIAKAGVDLTLPDGWVEEELRVIR